MSTLLQKSQQILNEKTTKIIPENIKSGITAFGVEGSVIELNGETKSINPSISQQIILPSTNKNAITQVTVNAVTNAIDNNIQSENIKKDVQILGVTGTYEGTGGGGSGDVKLFDTVAHMQADPDAQEGDLAVVYREELTGIDENSEFSSCTFPNTVVLSSAYTDNAYCSFRSIDQSSYFDGMVDVSSTYFRCDIYSDDLQLEITYTSSDGITYTRTDGGEELVGFGTTVKFESSGEPFPEVVSNFMKIGGNYFEGLYENVIDNTYYINNYYNAEYQNGQVITTQVNSPLNLSELNQTLINAGKNISGTRLVIISGNTTYLLSTTSFIIWLPIDNKFHIGNGSRTDNTYSYIEIENNVVTSGTITSGSNYSYKNTSGGTAYAMPLAFTSVDAIFTITDLDKVPTVSTIGVYYSADVSQNCSRILSNTTSGSITATPYNIYKLTSTQIDATSDFVYEKTFYGKNGVETGELGNPNNTFTDGNAEVYAKIQEQYDTMIPKILTDSNKTVDKNIKIIPIKSSGTPLFDTSQLTNMNQVFYQCRYLVFVPLLDTSNVTNMNYAFAGCTNLKSISLLDTSSVTSMEGIFADCSSLVSVPLLDTSSVTTMSEMFVNDISLVSVPLLDTSNVTNMNNMFGSCSSLTSIPQLDTSSVTNMSWMFNSCSSLVSVPILNTSRVTSMYYTFSSCTSLSNESLNNILTMCVNVNSGYTNNKTLKDIGLSSTQATTCTTLSNWSAAQAAGWTTGY